MNTLNLTSIAYIYFFSFTGFFYRKAFLRAVARWLPFHILNDNDLPRSVRCGVFIL